MPSIPKKQKERPWIPKRKPFEGRSLELMPFYNSHKWRKLRRIHLAKYPLCAHCEKEGVTTVAVHVDHIEPITPENWNVIGLKESNLQSLCLRCHNRKTAKQ